MPSPYSNNKEPKIIKLGHTAGRHGSNPDVQEKGNSNVRDLEAPKPKS